MGCPCGPSGDVLCNLLRTRGACAMRHPLSWREGGGNSQRSFLACAPAASARSAVWDFSFWLVRPDWDPVRGLGPAWTVCVGTENDVFEHNLSLLRNIRYYKSRMCGFFSLRPFCCKQRDIKRTLPYTYIHMHSFRLKLPGPIT